MNCEIKPCIQNSQYTFWSILKGFLSEHLALFIIFIGILLVVPFKDILLPHIIGKLYAQIKKKDGNLMFYVGFIIITVIFVQIIFVISDYLRIIMLPMMQKYFRDKMMNHFIESRSSNYDEIQVGMVVATMNKMPLAIYNVIDKWRYSYLPAFVTVIGAFVYFLWLDYVIGLTFFIILAIFAFVIWNTFNNCLSEAVERDRVINDTHNMVDDILRNMITVLSGNTFDQEMNMIDLIHDKYVLLTKGTMKCSLTGKYVMITSVIVYFIFLCWYCYHFKKLEGSKFISVLIIMFIVINVILSVTTSLNDSLLKWGIVKNSLEIFDVCEPQITPYLEAPRSNKGLVFQDVWFGYNNENVIFKDLNLTIETEKVTIIEGKNGSGKSTLINLLLKFFKPQCGEIFLDGVPYSKMTQHDLRNKIAYIPQMPILLNRTVYDNIIYGIENHKSKEEIVSLMAELNLGDFLNALPKGLDSEVGLYGSHLSGGQKQIVWLLKMIIQDPDFIIMDEPTAAIDSDNKHLVTFLIKTLMDSEKKRTIIMVTHDPEFKKVNDEYLYISI